MAHDEIRRCVTCDGYGTACVRVSADVWLMGDCPDCGGEGWIMSAAEAAEKAASAPATPNHCHACGWYPDRRIFYPQPPLSSCVGCGLWLCIACQHDHECASSACTVGR